MGKDSCTVEFRRLGQCFKNWATVVVGEAGKELSPSSTTAVAQSTKSPGGLYGIPGYGSYLGVRLK